MSRSLRILGSLAVLLAAGASLAQEAPARPPVERASEVPDADKLQRSTQALVVMRGVLTEVQAKLVEARGTKDVVKLNCVNEKLTQIKGLLRISEQADVALQEAVARRDSTSSEHEYTKVTIARQKVSQLNAETEECVGQLLFRTDENLSVDVEEPRDLPGGDPTQPQPPGNVIARPPPASPTE
ncbi:hypothetical protein [Stigmatella erecta]|uniref:Uncharacterized protein n=1 Tax=Stigmatella erecta TaxID=83460 RepID=A0A1I0LE91_9BACT|nr:hypothetical protein [Stigmatella erecta]SEU38492.1 hypothetical protein SAMN05443639_12714 [Stigmatella erecta]